MIPKIRFPGFIFPGFIFVALWARICFVAGIPWRGFCAIGRFFRSIWRGILATPGAIWRTPLRMYRRLTVWRNWILAKVQYLQDESAKWRTAFTIAKLPFTALRACGLNPQAAAAVLIAGSTGAGAIAVNEITSERSFSRGDPGIYSAPLDTPVFAAAEFNTLRLDLGATSVGRVEIDSISLGAS